MRPVFSVIKPASISFCRVSSSGITIRSPVALAFSPLVLFAPFVGTYHPSPPFCVLPLNATSGKSASNHSLTGISSEALQIKDIAFHLHFSQKAYMQGVFS